MECIESCGTKCLVQFCRNSICSRSYATDNFFYGGLDLTFTRRQVKVFEKRLLRRLLRAFLVDSRRGCIHNVLYLSASRVLVLVISRLCSEHLLSNRRPLLFAFPTPCFSVTPPHCSSSLPTVALKSPSITSFVGGRRVTYISVYVGIEPFPDLLCARQHTLLMVMKRLSLTGRRSFVSLLLPRWGGRGSV